MVNIERIMAYENGELDTHEVIEFYQELIDTGLAWELQGTYGRTAAALIQAGECTIPVGPVAVEELVSVGRRPLNDPDTETFGVAISEDDKVYAMHGMDDGPAPKHVGPIWAQEAE